MILVSGGAGFLGSHLVERLIADRFDVRVVDDFSSSELTYQEVKDLWGEPFKRMDLYRESIQTYEKRPSAYLNAGHITGIFHLASPVGPAGILPYAGSIVRQIVDATYAVIALATFHHCRLIYVSSSEVYGGGVDGLCSEDTPCVVKIDNPTPRLEYAIGKLAGEIAALNTKDLDAVAIRPFNISGPRQSRKGGFVLPTFVQQALNGEPLTVYGDGSQLRAFTHVQDIVDGLLLAMGNGQSGQAYNLGNPANKTTILNLAKDVILAVRPDLCVFYPDAENLEHESFMKFVDGKSVHGSNYAEASDKFPDATKATTELGWEPKYSVGQIIADAIEYEKEKRKK